MATVANLGFFPFRAQQPRLHEHMRDVTAQARKLLAFA